MKGCVATRYLITVTGINIRKLEKVADLPINKKG